VVVERMGKWSLVERMGKRWWKGWMTDVLAVVAVIVTVTGAYQSKWEKVA
jgi:hypothetical protein